MTYSDMGRVGEWRGVAPGGGGCLAGSPVGVTVYGCGWDEAELVREVGPRVGVVATVAEAAVSEANVGLAVGNRCVSVGHKSPVSNATLLALSRVGVAYVSTRSIGFNHIDVEYASRVGIAVGNVAYSPDSVADYTLMLMLMAVRGVKSVLRRVDVHDYRVSGVRGRELRDLTVGVVGTGRIGAAVLDRLRGFGCRTLAYDIRPRGGAEYVPLDELVERSDIVTLHAPLAAETRHLLDRGRIERMKRGAFVVNTGRGALVDTDALISGLESGRLGGAALDVVEGEEGVFYADCRGDVLDDSSVARLQGLPNVIVTPHIAYYTDHSLRDMVVNSLVNCVDFESGKLHG